MFVRLALVCACLMGTASAVAAQELGPDEARAFVVGKLFAYTCFDGTVGLGRIFADGSVVGTIRGRGQTETRFAALPANTIRVNGNAMCASLPGLPIQPCFKVQKLDRRSFRGSTLWLRASPIAISTSIIRAASSPAGPRCHPRPKRPLRLCGRRKTDCSVL